MSATLQAHGPVFRAGDSGYDTERCGYNLAVEHRPEVIVGATGAADVIAAVRHARDHGLPLAEQATGHGASIPADGAVLVSTRRMTGVRVDPDARTIRFEAGVASGRLVHEAAIHGLAPLNGSAPEVGAVSYVLGGGVPMLGRKFGFAVDHVRALDVVTADGELRCVAVDREPDLFWALRGGKGNFGVVVSVLAELVPVARIFGGGMYFPAESAARLLHTYRAWVEGVPDEMGSSLLLITMPDLPAVPEPLRGRYVVHVRIAYIGSLEDGERLIRPLRDVGPRLIDTVREMPYREVGSIHLDPTTPVPFLGNNAMLRVLEPGTVDALLEHAGPEAKAPYFVELRHFGGAFCRPSSVPSSLGRRDGMFCAYAGSVVPPGETDAMQAAQTALLRALAPWATGGVCLNFLSGPHVTLGELRSGYLPADFVRLQRLKTRYDPDNLFRINHNIPPG